MPQGKGPAGRVGATNVERRFLDAVVGAADRGGRPSPEMPRGSDAPTRHGGGLVRLSPSLSVPQAGRPSPEGWIWPWRGVYRRWARISGDGEAGWWRRRAAREEWIDLASEPEEKKEKKKWGPRVGWK
jgi:hypothetical protein